MENINDRVFLAHYAESNGIRREQSLKDHCRHTAQYAQQCLSEAGLGNTAYVAGLLHDLGKATNRFQDYLLGRSNTKRGDVIHTFQGCKLIFDLYHDGTDVFQDLSSEIIAAAIASHHGLFDCVASDGRIGLKYRDEKEDIDYSEAVYNFQNAVASDEEIDSYFKKAVEEIRLLVQRVDPLFMDESDEEFSFIIGLIERLVTSSVIEGDRRDTSEFLSGSIWLNKDTQLTDEWKKELNYMETKLGAFPCDTPINIARSRISEKCKSFAKAPGNIYRLNIPTGGGKTLSSLRYALAHALEHSKKHIIFTSPLLSILEQNAQVIRNYIEDQRLILEHHSNVVQSNDLSTEQLDYREFLMETWDAPIIITTLVQLLNTLFESRTAAVRRFHSLCQSVIVIDEVQTVPTKMLSLFNLAVRFLQIVCGSTIVLCSATQPSLEKAHHPLPDNVIDIVPYDEDLWSVFERTSIFVKKGRKLEDMSSLIRACMLEEKSLLVVCNKKTEASYLFEQTMDDRWDSFHLSAGMCVQHRRDVTRKLFEALKSERKVLCVSTQVIEAGVDVSFGQVIRFEAGMDSVIQSAGRCNRNGEYNSLQPVYLINCTDERLGNLPEIQKGKDATTSLVDAFQRKPEMFVNNLMSRQAIDYYYKTLYSEMAINAQDYPIKGKGTILDLLSNNTVFVSQMGDREKIQSYYLRQAFKTAGECFNVFDEDTIDVLVPYGEGKDLIVSLTGAEADYNLEYRKHLIEKASLYTVSIYREQKKQWESIGAIYSICEGSIIVMREEFYDRGIGIRKIAGKQSFLEV